MRDRILRAGLNAESAEYTAAVIDVVDLCVALVAADPLGIRTRIVNRLDINAVRRTRRGTQIACDAFLFSVLVDKLRADEFRTIAIVVLKLDTRAGLGVLRRDCNYIRELSAGDVECNVEFTRQTPILNGLPASGVSVTARGSWQWLVGDPGDPDYEMLSYGTVYHALGWSITPTSEGTTFINDATGHGMTVSVEGFTPF